MMGRLASQEVNSKIYATFVLQLCDLVAPLVLIFWINIRKTNLSYCYILGIHSSFVNLNSSLR